MASVNELADSLEQEARSNRDNQPARVCGDGINYAAHQLRQVARTAWNPVSEPPHAESDGDHEGFVLIWLEGVGLGMTHVNKMDRLPPEAQWARIRDVVLLPGGE